MAAKADHPTSAINDRERRDVPVRHVCERGRDLEEVADRRRRVHASLDVANDRGRVAPCTGRFGVGGDELVRESSGVRVPARTRVGGIASYVAKTGPRGGISEGQLSAAQLPFSWTV